MDRKLYQWQEECLERWWANGKRGMVQAVTGAGKTRLALGAIERLEKQLQGELRVKIVVPTGGLMRQWYKALREFLADSERMQSRGWWESIGLRGAGHRDTGDRKYVIYVINSARYELARKILDEVKDGKNVFLIADECHHYESGQNRLIFEFLPYLKSDETHFFSLGLSATLPSGAAGSFLSSVLGKKIYSYEMRRAFSQKTVCTFDAYHISVPFRKEERYEYEEVTERMQGLYRKLLFHCPMLGRLNQKERFETLRKMAQESKGETAENAALYIRLTYKRKSLVCLAAARCACAYDLIQCLGMEDKVIIFGERISQVEELYGLLEKRYPGRVGRYHSEMGDQANRNTLENFRSGTFRILAACKAVDEGIDIPDAQVGIILSGTSSKRQKIQRLGRILRKQEGKECAALYYIHVEDTSEESCFLPEGVTRHIYELEYKPGEHEFIHQAYDETAQLLREAMKQKGIDETKMQEMERCIRLGRVRSDWMADTRTLEKKVKESRYPREKNYWICMKKMAEFLKF